MDCYLPCGDQGSHTKIDGCILSPETKVIQEAFRNVLAEEMFKLGFDTGNALRQYTEQLNKFDTFWNVGKMVRMVSIVLYF